MKYFFEESTIQFLLPRLKIVLRHDPKKRGITPTANGTLLCFGKIRDILNMRIVKVLNVLEAADISYVCQPGDTILTLKMFIHQENGMEPSHQLLLYSASGELLPDQNLLAECCSYEDHFYLFNKNTSAPHHISSVLPDKVRELVGDPEMTHKCSELRLYWAQASYYCHKKAADYMRLLQSQHALICSLERKWAGMEKLKEQLQIAAIRLETVIEMFTLSLEYDRESYNPQIFGEDSKHYLDEWEGLSARVYSMRKYMNIKTQLNDVYTRIKVQLTEIVAKYKDEFHAQKNTSFGAGHKKNELDEM